MSRLRFVGNFQQGNSFNRVAPNPDRMKRITPMIREAAAAWTPQLLLQYIANGTIPEEYLQAAMNLLKSDATLIVVQKEDFVAAIQQEYPDLFAILVTQAGDAWLDKCLLELFKRTSLSVFDFLRGK